MRDGDSQHVRIGDFSDRELLALLIDMGHQCSGREMAQRVWNVPDDDPDLTRLTRCVTSRLVWMRRFGLVVRDGDGAWQISTVGLALRTDRTTTQMATQISELKESKLLDLANTVGVKLVSAGQVEGRAMQRELAYQINRRRTRLKGW